MNKDSKIYIAGHNGLVGSALWRKLQSAGYHNLVGRSHRELDLLDAVSVCQFFDQERPDIVFLAAAFVGGIAANNSLRADFIYKNIGIQYNVIGESFRHNVKKLLFLGSTCIYPKDAPQPLKEEALLTAPLEYTNEPYAIAKIAGLKMCESFNLQYGTNYIAVMPTNLYGFYDNFHLNNSHVLPAMMRKISLAHALESGDETTVRKDLASRPIEGLTSHSDWDTIRQTLAQYGIMGEKVSLWGTGTPLREFLWSDDLADACLFIMEHYNFRDLQVAQGNCIRNTHINIGSGEEISIKMLAEVLARQIGYKGMIQFDPSKPDGTPRKCTDVTLLHQLGWHHTTSLEEGIAQLYHHYMQSIR